MMLLYSYTIRMLRYPRVAQIAIYIKINYFLSEFCCWNNDKTSHIITFQMNTKREEVRFMCSLIGILARLRARLCHLVYSSIGRSRFLTIEVGYKTSHITKHIFFTGKYKQFCIPLSELLTNIRFFSQNNFLPGNIEREKREK